MRGLTSAQMNGRVVTALKVDWWYHEFKSRRVFYSKWHTSLNTKGEFKHLAALKSISREKQCVCGGRKSTTTATPWLGDVIKLKMTEKKKTIE